MYLRTEIKIYNYYIMMNLTFAWSRLHHFPIQDLYIVYSLIAATAIMNHTGLLIFYKFISIFINISDFFFSDWFRLLT